MKFLMFFVFATLIAAQCFAVDCDYYRNEIIKEFKVKDNEARLELKDKSDYDKMKKIVQDIPVSSESFDKYRKSIAKENPELSAADGEADIYRSTCLFSEFKGIDPMIQFVSKNKKDKKLVKDLETFLKPRIAIVKSSPIFTPMLIKGAYAKELAGIKYGEDSELYKDFGKILKDGKNQSHIFMSEFQNLKIKDKNKKFSDLTKEEIKQILPIMRKEEAASSEYAKKLFELVSKI